MLTGRVKEHSPAEMIFTAELKVCLLVSLIPSWQGLGHGHLRNMCVRYCNQTVHSSAHRGVSTLENASLAQELPLPPEITKIVTKMEDLRNIVRSLFKVIFIRCWMS